MALRMILLTAACGAALLHSTDASACSCAGDNTSVRPSDSDVAVPANTRVWVFSHGWACPSPALVDQGGAAVDTTSSVIEPGLLVLTPTGALQVGNSYTVDCGEESWVNETFAVTSEADATTPAVPIAEVDEIETSEPGSSCGDYEYARMSVQHDGFLLMLDIDGRGSVDPEAMTGTVVDLFAGDFIYVGESACEQNWSFDEDGDATAVRFASFDLAGNFSGWSERQQVDTDCGCTVVGSRSQSSGAWLTVGLLALALARIRRRPVTS